MIRENIKRCNFTDKEQEKSILFSMHARLNKDTLQNVLEKDRVNSKGTCRSGSKAKKHKVRQGKLLADVYTAVFRCGVLSEEASIEGA
ncbi:MAG: hypothetical protein GX087_10725 [Desulfobulbaceae bacterium]|nr:hypothetical protein [Desulfobulbaceae bacterium]